MATPGLHIFEILGNKVDYVSVKIFTLIPLYNNKSSLYCTGNCGQQTHVHLTT